MPSWAPHIDTTTGAPVISQGRLLGVSQALSQVQHAVATEQGSVSGLPGYGAGIATLTHVTDGLLRDIERRIDAAVRPLVGVVVDAYQRQVTWDSAGHPQVEVWFQAGSTRDTLTFRIGS